LNGVQPPLEYFLIAPLLGYICFIGFSYIRSLTLDYCPLLLDSNA
jgi:hypothetical protein